MTFNREKDAGDMIDKMLKTLDDFWGRLVKLSGRKINLDTFLKNTENYVDERVRNICMKNKLVCFGGKMYISTDTSQLPENGIFGDRDILKLKIDLFFKDTESKWVQSVIEGNILLKYFNLDDEDTREFIFDGITKGFEAISYNAPEE